MRKRFRRRNMDMVWMVWRGAARTGWWNFKRRGLHGVEPGKGQADCRKVFGEGLDREAGVQAGAAGIVWFVTRSPGTAPDRNRVAFRGSKGIRFDCGKSA